MLPRINNATGYAPPIQASAPPSVSSESQSSNPYPNGITIPGTGANGASTTYQDFWDPSTGTWAIHQGADNAVAPIYTGAQWNTGALGTKGLGSNETVNGGTLNIANKGGGSTDVVYGIDPKTGLAIPQRSVGNGQKSWWQSTGIPAAEIAAAVAGAAFGGEALLGAAGATDAGAAAPGVGDLAGAFAGSQPAADAAFTELGSAPIDVSGAAAATGGVGVGASSFDPTSLNAAYGPDAGANLPSGYGTITPDQISAPVQSAGGYDYGLNSYGGLNSGGSGPNLGNVGGDLSKLVGGIGGALKSAAGPAALLGTTALVGKGLQRDASQYADQYKSLAAQPGALASQQFKQASTGQLQPWQQASIDQMVQQERAKAGQFFADTGQGGSQGKAGGTNELAVGTQIDTNALIQQGQFQQQAVSDYLQTFDKYSGLMSKGIEAQIAGDKELQALWGDVLGGLAKASAAGGGGGGGGGSSDGGFGQIASSIISIGSKIFGG